MEIDLKFVPRGNQLVPQPGHRAEHGAQPRRICAQVKGHKWQISARPHAVRPGTREALLMIRLCQKGGVAPYDQMTASACGVPFEPLEWRDGDQGWLPATRPASTSVTSSTRRKTFKTEED